jgi:3-hydroxyacyl-CoA dehydrogenase
MGFRLKKAAVLGSGVMGSGIACHLANVGMDVVLLDIVPFDISEDQKNNPTVRNSIVNGALNSAIKNKPAALYNKKFASRITTGNFTDDFDKIADADWIIEVVVERLDIKKQIFEKVEAHRKPGSLISSNTSSIPINMLVEGRSEDFQSHFCGTHFFNPPRYMRLLEVIPHTGTAKEVIDFFMDFGDRILGKQTVLCKDTPAFIANRIGVMSGTEVLKLTMKHDLTIEEVDALTGPLIGRPNTATFRLQDLVGIDTSDKVSDFVLNNVEGDEYIDSIKGESRPPFMDFLLENKFFGNKSGKGFYEKTNKRDEKGKRIINALDLKTNEYKPATKPRLDLIGTAKKIELMDKRLQTIIDDESREGTFLSEYFAAVLAYSSNRVPEISDEFYPVDDAMRAGYMWDFGPFEVWDLIGLERGIQLVESKGYQVADWVKELKSSGVESFYKLEDGKRKYYDLASKSYQAVPSSEGFIILDAYRSKNPVIKNSECTVHDIGDGVMCLEFQSKSNSIGEGIGQGLAEAIYKAEADGWNGLVIGNNAKNFTVGANLMPVGMMAMQKDFKTLDKMVNDFQQLTMLLRTSKIPTVISTQGYVFGGGCEMGMHCDGGVYAAESYIGLVEVGVGLLPGGGGTKEMALRAGDKFFEGDVQIPTLIEHFKPIATASVATSAWEAYDLNLLDITKDEVCVNAPRNITRAKEKVLELAKGYIPKGARNNVKVLGRSGLSTLYTAINEFRLGGFMSDYDVEIAKKVAYVICGGDLTQQQEVSEQYLLDIEREGFLSLLGNQKTLDRIQHILMYNKPLRN